VTKIGDAGGIAADQLRSVIERIEMLNGDIDELKENVKDIYDEAKGNGFDVKVLRQIVRRRKLEKAEREEQDELLALSEAAVEGAAP
jgi:uncharacterized protein (UPF0335 family)